LRANLVLEGYGGSIRLLRRGGRKGTSRRPSVIQAIVRPGH
jgi:hypothetical protein